MSEANNTEAHVPIDAATRDKLSPVWDMSQERVFIENLFNQRFSFFLVVFSIVLAGAINSKAQLHLQTVLTVGAIVTSLFDIPSPWLRGGSLNKYQVLAGDAPQAARP